MNNLEITKGVYDIPNLAYHEHKAVSRSQLMRLKKTPFHYWYEYESEAHEIEEAKEHFTFGSALHTAVLEPHLFHKEYCVMPKIDRRTKQGKIDFEMWTAENQGKEYLTNEQYELIVKMAKSIHAHEQASSIISGAKIEQSLFWTDEETNIQCKIRPDIWQPKLIGDLKTTQDASQWSFEKSMLSYGYHIQAAMIREGIKQVLNQDMKDFVYIVIEKQPPYAIAIYILDESALERGYEEFKILIKRLAECRYKNEWPSYQPGIVKLPNYALHQEI